ncbi:MAG: 16S rRNA (adenine(1518)-N(6)/adenine(1519)-N(6))-dimethyltransferase RsmA [Eubacteriales bacterium]
MNSGNKAKKALGQNFLIDDEIIKQIVVAGIGSSKSPVVEIGAGPGGMTRVIAEKTKRLWAVEIDQEKINILRKEIKEESIKIINMDALNVNLKDLWGEEKGLLLGNLPYYITNPLIMHYLNQSDSLLQMTVMVQKEVAERMVASPVGKQYGILSIAVQLQADAKILFEVPPSAFWPQPKVTSAVVKLEIRPYPGFVVDRGQFFRVVKAAFAQRRKTLVNCLSNNLKIEKECLINELKIIGISDKQRAETLSIDDFQKLTKIIEKME